jgi:predicted dehydrogenase
VSRRVPTPDPAGEWSRTTTDPDEKGWRTHVAHGVPRIGLVGAGGHANRNILPVLSYLPVDLVSITDRDVSRAAAAAHRFGAARHYGTAADMYANEELDAVLLVVSPALHPALAIEAFGHGLDVWSEKPAATGSGQINDMIGARGSNVCVVGYKKAFMPATHKVTELLDGPAGGPPLSASAVYPVAIPCIEPEDRGRRPYPVSNWLTSGCHSLSVLRAVLGPVATVTTHRGRRGGAICVLMHINGAVSSLHLAEGASKFQPCERYHFVTSTASVTIENSRKVIYQRGLTVDYAKDFTFAPDGLDSGAIVWEAQDTMATMQGKSVVTQGIFGGLAAFVEAVQTRKNPDIGSLEFARDVTLVYEAALESDGETVQLP